MPCFCIECGKWSLFVAERFSGEINDGDFIPVIEPDVNAPLLLFFVDPERMRFFPSLTGQPKKLTYERE